jgi:hypothetical protein
MNILELAEVRLQKQKGLIPEVNISSLKYTALGVIEAIMICRKLDIQTRNKKVAQERYK